jgi:hypothetical protein
LNIPEAPWSNLVMDTDVAKAVLSGERLPIGRNVLPGNIFCFLH